MLNHCILTFEMGSKCTASINMNNIDNITALKLIFFIFYGFV